MSRKVVDELDDAFHGPDCPVRVEEEWDKGMYV